MHGAVGSSTTISTAINSQESLHIKIIRPLKVLIYSLSILTYLDFILKKNIMGQCWGKPFKHNESFVISNSWPWVFSVTHRQGEATVIGVMFKKLQARIKRNSNSSNEWKKKHSIQAAKDLKTLKLDQYLWYE